MHDMCRQTHSAPAALSECQTYLALGLYSQSSSTCKACILTQLFPNIMAPSLLMAPTVVHTLSGAGFGGSANTDTARRP